MNVQKSAEAIVAERQRVESVGVPSTTGKGGMTGMAENLEEKGCPQKDSAEHERYAGVPRSFRGIWKERNSAQRNTDTFRRLTKRKYISPCTSTIETAV